MVTLKNLSKSFGSHTVLKNINASFPDTGLVLIEGENGSGKSTLLNILGLLDDEYEGEVMIDEMDIKKLDRKDRSKFISDNISYIFQKDNLLSFLSLEENKDFGKGNQKYKRKESIRNASEGEKELAVLNAKLTFDKEIYLLDEPFHALDKQNTDDLVKKVNELARKSLVIIVDHEGNIKEGITQRFVIKKGVISLLYSSENNVIEEEHKKENLPHLQFPFVKSLRKYFLPSFFHAIILFFLIFFTWDYGMETWANKAEYLYRGFVPDNFITIAGDIRNTDSSFPYNLMVEDVVLDQNISDDGMIHRKPSGATTTQTYPISYKTSDYDIAVVQDEAIQNDLIYANPNLLSHIPFENSSGQFNLRNLRWKTSFFDPETYLGKDLNDTNGIRVFYGNRAKEIYSGSLEDGVFYVPPIFKEWVTENPVFGTYTSSSNPEFTTGSDIDYGNLYPGGMKVKELNTDFTFPSDGTNRLNFWVVVSDNTAERIWNALGDGIDTFGVWLSKDNIKTIADFTNSHDFQPIHYLTANNINDSNNVNLGNYARMKNYEMSSSFMPPVLIGIDSLLFLLLALGQVHSFLIYGKKDIKILYSYGFSKNKLFFMLQSSFYLLLFCFIPLSYPLIYFSIASARSYPFLPTPDWRLSLFFMLSFAVIIVLQYLYFLFKTRKHF